MDLRKVKSSRRFAWHVFAICVGLGVVVVVIVVFTLLTSIFLPTEGGAVSPVIWALATILLLIAVILIAVIATLSKIISVQEAIQRNGARLEQIAELLEKSRSTLTQITQSVRLSEATRAMVFRDADKQTLREAVFDKLQQQDFEATERMIDEIAQRPAYTELSEQLRTESANYRNATDAERVNQVIRHIDKLFENHEWAKASIQIERLIRENSTSDKIKALRQKLVDKKQERKKILLTAWDDAITRQDPDRSIEILRELDMYLTPNEGLALQEAARDVFKTKLHNLGVQFSLAISEKQWAKALQTGQLIVKGFPNSRMAQEIRVKWDVLEQKVAEQAI